MAWSMKGHGGPPLPIIHFFYKQKVSLALQRVQATTILHQVIVATKEASSRLGVLPSFSHITLHDLFCAIGDEFRS
jgi:hypothetical protein